MISCVSGAFEGNIFSNADLRFLRCQVASAKRSPRSKQKGQRGEGREENDKDKTFMTEVRSDMHSKSQPNQQLTKQTDDRIHSLHAKGVTSISED